MKPWEALEMTPAEWEAAPIGMRVAAALVPFWGWGYGGPGAAYRPHKAFPSGLVDSRGRETNCSTLTACLLMALYPSAPWTTQSYCALQVWESFGKDAPIDAVESVGVGSRTTGLVPGAWHLVQGWRPSGTGHAFLVLADRDGNPEECQRVHAGTAHGVEWRMDSWERIEAEYRAGLYLAVLRG